MVVKYDIRKNAYYDSVTLMLISKEIKKMDGVDEVLVGMGTELNKELAGNLDLAGEDVIALSANDFFIAARLEDEGIMNSVIDMVEELLTQKKTDAGSDYQPVSLDTAISYQPESNMAIISVAGKYAYREVKKCLDNDLHVMLFSDNVSVEDERELKELAVKKGLLMMGPDCGTAIINNVPLAFANVVSKGNIGVVGASGTGTQEVTVIIDKLGGGVSQVIGTGGRDLKSEIGGLMMIQGIEALIEDENTEVIVLISKPPAKEVAVKVLELAKTTKKPFVVDFIGGDSNDITNVGAYACTTLEDTAYKAVALSKGEKVVTFDSFNLATEEINKIIENEVSNIDKSQKYFRGLFTGGTLADEAMKMIGSEIGGIYSNIPLEPEYELLNIDKLSGNACIDLGDDMFTVGRPHPMIEPSTRTERLVDCVDEDVALLLFDVVLGYGSHEDPAGEMVEPVKEAMKKLADKGKKLTVICSICGTEKDPQSLDASKKVLEDIGVIVMPSNAQACRLSLEILKKL